MEEQFTRAEMLLGSAALETLSASHVAVVGLGGVGSWCAEALCRTGVGALTLLDQDTVSVSNLNRQAGALWSTVGRSKAEALAERLADINPACRLTPHGLPVRGRDPRHLFSPEGTTISWTPSTWSPASWT